MSKNNYHYMKRDVMGKIISLTETKEAGKMSPSLDHFPLYMRIPLNG